MRIIHLADTHLGFRQMHYTYDGGRNIREQDVYDAFTNAVDTIIELQPAAVVHAGDLFDGYHPPAAALGVALDQIARLRDAGIPLVVIAGNHSTPRAAAADHIFTLLERFGGTMAVHAKPAQMPVGDLAVTAVPHSNDPDQLSEWLRSARPSSDHRFNVLVAHVGFDGLGHVGAGEAGSHVISGEVLEAGAGFDYVALGHLHMFGRSRINAVYAGSLESLSWADNAPWKGVVEVDLAQDPSADAYITRHETPRRPRVWLPTLDASSVDDLSAAIIQAAGRTNIREALVKQPIVNVTPAAFSAIDRRNVDKAFGPCLHFELEPEFVGASGTSPSVTAPQDLRDFLARRVPQGVDADEFITRAESYMTRAAEEIAG